MNNRERVLATLHHQQPDKTPYNIGFTQNAYQKMADYLGDPQFGEKINNCCTWFSVGPQGQWREVAPSVWEDPFGVQWNKTWDKDIGVIWNRIITPENIDDYRWPEAADYSHLATVRIREDQFIVAEIGFSLFERAWVMTGMENLLADMIDNPAFVHRFLDKILELNHKIINKACSYDIDAMYFGDDWGQQTGLIMGPVLWREFIKPRIAQMYRSVKSHGKYVCIHSCGKVDSIFPDLIELGLDIFNPFQPEVIDVFDAKKRYGDRLTFYGGISTQRTLPFATPQQVKDEVRKLLEVVGKDGGLIAAPAHAIPGDARPENIAAMLEVLENQ